MCKLVKSFLHICANWSISIKDEAGEGAEGKGKQGAGGYVDCGKRGRERYFFYSFSH